MERPAPSSTLCAKRFTEENKRQTNKNTHTKTTLHTYTIHIPTPEVNQIITQKQWWLPEFRQQIKADTPREAKMRVRFTFKPVFYWCCMWWVFLVMFIVFVLTLALVYRYEDALASRCALKVLFIIIIRLLVKYESFLFGQDDTALLFCLFPNQTAFIC